MNREDKKQAVWKAIEPARRELEQLRKRSGSRRVEIPERLLRMAAIAAKAHGVGSVSSRLGISSYHLKKKVLELSGETGRLRRKQKFVELLPLSVAKCPTNVLEFEKPSGLKLRIEFGGSLPPELIALGERLWRAPE